MDYLLDTNILLIYTRGNHVARKIEDELKLLKKDNNLVTSVVSIDKYLNK